MVAFIPEFLENLAIVDVKRFSLNYLILCMARESFRLAHALALKSVFSNMFLFYDVNNVNSIVLVDYFIDMLLVKFLVRKDLEWSNLRFLELRFPSRKDLCKKHCV